MFQQPERVDLTQENAPKEKVLHATLTNGVYVLPENEQELGEEFGLTPPFPPERLDIMRARAESNGYRLEVH